MSSLATGIILRLKQETLLHVFLLDMYTKKIASHYNMAQYQIIVYDWFSYYLSLNVNPIIWCESSGCRRDEDACRGVLGPDSVLCSSINSAQSRNPEEHDINL